MLHQIDLHLQSLNTVIDAVWNSIRIGVCTRVLNAIAAKIEPVSLNLRGGDVPTQGGPCIRARGFGIGLEAGAR